MATARQAHTATLLSTGKVLVAGGSNGSAALASAELYDPATRSWAATASMTGARQLHTAVQLATSSNTTTSGKVLIAGGVNGSTSQSTAQLYSPTAGTWVAAGNLNVARHAHGATRLSDGKVLVTGGLSGSTTLLSAAIYNPASGAGAWAATTGPLPPTGQRAHSATLLATSNTQLANKVLLAGGNSGSATLSAVYLFDPAQSAFSTLQPMPSAREGHSATVLANGKLLLAGGKNASSTLASAVVFDPSSGPGSWSTVGSMTTARQGHSATLLPDGRVLVAGGSSGSSTLSSAELFTTASNTWAATAAMPASAQGHTATLLTSGIVLIAGGVSGTTTLSAARLYDVTLGNSCSTNSQCAGGICAGGVCCNTTCTDQCSSCTLAGSVGTCSPKANGTSCSDASACTLGDTCQAGSCTGGTPKTCAASDMCHTAGTCDSATGTCSNPVGPDKVGCSINLRFDGVVDAGGGNFVAVFGHNSTATSSFHPTSSVVAVNGTTVSGPHPAPPAYLPPGQHAGSFLPTFSAGQTITWTVDGQTVTASQASTHLTKLPIGESGYGVTIAGDVITIKADTDKYLTPPAPPGQAADPTAGLSEFTGTIKGELSVSPSGAAIYKLPLTLAPGIAGVAPNLALVYSSQFGSGIAGQGWDLSGLSMVHRCALTRAENGVAHPITLSGPAPGDDGLCLDGKQLFYRGPSSDGEGVRYQLELGDFSDITLRPDPLFEDGSTITVVSKTGETRYYGLDDSTRVQVPGYFASNPTSDGRTTGIWLLQKVVDVWGNYYEVFYNQGHSDFEANGIVLSQIKYTGRLPGGPGGSGADVPPFQIVRFGYEARPDVRHGRLRSAIVPRNKRLKTIDTGIGVYTLDYLQPSSPPSVDDVMLPSRLSTITYCPVTGDCAKPLAFDWDGGGYGWAERPGYTLPVGIGPFDGSQFLDLDGDGRNDIVSSKVGGASRAWRNNGNAFEAAPSSWTLPGDLALYDDDQHARTNTGFGDLDGDGSVDGMHIDPTFATTCPSSTGYCTQTAIHVQFNRIRTAGNWSSFYPWIAKSAEWAQHVGARLLDVNGDGRADIVSSVGGGNDAADVMRVVLMPAFDFVHPNNTLLVDGSANYGGVAPMKNYDFRDVNRDGLPDLVGKYNTPDAGKTYVNTGDVLPGHSSVWVSFDALSMPGHVPPDMQSTADFDGDGFLDVLQFGCRGTPDNTGHAFPPNCEVSPSSNFPIPFTSTIALSTGLGYDPVPSTDPRLAVLAGFTPPTNDWNVTLEDWTLTPVDINADGLADLVQRKQDIGGFPDPKPGRVLFNTGQTFVALDGATSWQDPLGSVPAPIPRMPKANHLSGDPNTTFVDLDGDGVTDLASTGMAWRNTFRPPVIRTFPNGLATKTFPAYEVITTVEAQVNGANAAHPIYKETTTDLTTGSAFRLLPVRVVTSIAADDGIGGTVKTNYEYRDFRVSSVGRGPQGFGSIIVTGPEDVTQPIAHRTRVAATTLYLQGFPYTGLPSKVTRELVDATTLSKVALVSVTTTDYCDAIPGNGEPCTANVGADPATVFPGHTRFVRPTTVIDSSFPLSTAVLNNGGVGSSSTVPLQISTTFEYDRLGNPTETKVTSSAGDETYEKKSVNVYGTRDSAEERLGKVTSSTVTARRVYPQDCLAQPAITHTTTFEYAQVSQFESVLDEGSMVSTLALKKTIVEPGSGAPIELHTAYEYDRFGNVTKTTGCANEFATCGQSGATGSSELPYRVTQVSYDPADFNVPVGSGLFDTLNYGAGRYPVKKTNAAGHVEMMAYDARFGTVLQRTDPNGGSVCQLYDGLGRQTFEIGHCGSGNQLLTRFQQFLTADAEFGQLKVVLVKTPPGASPTWTYTDRLGRPSMTITRAFDSQYSKTLTLYDNLGRTLYTTKPFLSTTAEFLLEGQALTTLAHYDAMGRVSLTSENLGVIDGTTPGSTNRIATTTTVYDGNTIRIGRTVNGETRHRTETKNALGKLASAVDANGVAAAFTYDADGNLTDTASPAEVCNPTGTNNNIIHLKYDARGRKQQSFDPDLGAWSYNYNGFGDLVTQTDAKLGVTHMTYDALGRMVERIDDSGTAQWIYDAAPHGIGKLAAMVSPSDSKLEGTCQVEFAPLPDAGEKRAGRSIHYTQFGELEEVTDCVDATPFVTTYGYDTFGRPSSLRYPEVNGQRFAVKYAYTPAGYLRYVADNADGNVLWAAKAMDAAGRVTDEILRNGVETQSVLNDANGWLLGRTATAHADGETVIQSLAHGFDEVGNLRSRVSNDAVTAASSTETFGYDALDRLLTSRVQVPSLTYDVTETYGFDNLGNLQTKVGKTYKYATGCQAGDRPAGPHALCQIDSGATYNYDGNGNLTSVGDRSVEWNAANKVTHLASGSGTVDFVYGADGQRIVQVAATSGGGTAARTVYVGLGATGKSVYERTTRGSAVEHSHFIYAGSAHGGNAFAIRVTSDGAASGQAGSEYQYHHFDHLGSVAAVSDGNGHVATAAWGGPSAGNMSYDPWGARRSPDGRAADPASFGSTSGNRGFTGHESIPNVGLVNMNGRIYDPVVGRFLSPDPNVQFASNLQSYNRYSYALGNPLRYSDPTGYFSFSVDTVVNFAVGAIAIGVCAGTAGAGCSISFAVMFAVYNTFSAVTSGASWDQAIAGAAFGFALSYGTASLGSHLGASILGDYPGAGQPLGAILGGVIGGAMAGVFMTPLTGGDLGENILNGAFRGGVYAGLTVAFQYALPGEPVKVNLNVKYIGGDANPLPADQAARYTAAAEKTWTGRFGKYEVTANFHDPTAKTVTVYVLNAASISQTNAVGGNIVELFTEGYFGGKAGDKVQPYTPAQVESVLAHELGHALGAADQYNRVTQTPFPGHESDLMGNGPVVGQRAFESTITEILQFRQAHP